MRVTYKKRFAPGLASWGMGIIPRHVYHGVDFNTDPANRAPIGTGPYRFKEWKTDQYILLEANPDYFEGRPYLERYVCTASFRIQAVQFLRDAITRRSIPFQPDARTNLKPTTLFSGDITSATAYPSRLNTIYMGFNYLKNELFKDLRVRQALAYGVDR